MSSTRSLSFLVSVPVETELKPNLVLRFSFFNKGRFKSRLAGTVHEISGGSFVASSSGERRSSFSSFPTPSFTSLLSSHLSSHPSLTNFYFDFSSVDSDYRMAEPCLPSSAPKNRESCSLGTEPSRTISLPASLEKECFFFSSRKRLPMLLLLSWLK